MVKRKVRRKSGSYFSSLISITLVLFLTAIFSMLVIYADLLKRYFKENVQVDVYFDDDAREADIFWLQKKLESDPKIKSATYITKEEAEKMMHEGYGEDAVTVLGYNPFPSSLEVYFKADYAEVDSIENFKSSMDEYAFVKDVKYQKVILKNIDKNVKIVGVILLVFMIGFLLIAIVLINNTIRLTMYSQRFLIKTQQMVGATKGFIRRPYVTRAIIYGLAGGIIANILVIAVLMSIDFKISIAAISDIKLNLAISFLVMIFGIFISGLSSYYSVNRYLRLKIDDLY